MRKFIALALIGIVTAGVPAASYAQAAPRAPSAARSGVVTTSRVSTRAVRTRNANGRRGHMRTRRAGHRAPGRRAFHGSHRIPVRNGRVIR